MKAILSRKAHGIADYAFAALTAFAPKLFGFEDNTKAVTLCRSLSAATLAYTLTTKAEWGAWKLLPYKAHLLTDFSAGLGNMAMPWLMGFAGDKRARNTILAFGAIAVTASLLSGVFSDDPESED